MTIFGLLGIILSLAGFRFARVSESRSRFVLFALLLLTHIGASLVYYLYAQEVGGDALMYYNDPYQVYGFGGGLSTLFVINFVQFLKSYFGGTLFDHFLLFQAMGFWGLLFVMRTFDDIHRELGQPLFKYVYLLLFLPGLHYWTSAIGKDAPLFLGVAMCVWAAYRVQVRYPAFAAGLGVCLLVRPHIALIALASFALTLVLDRSTKLLTRAALLVVAVAGIGTVATLVENSFVGLSLTQTDSVTEFIETKSNVSEESGGDVSIINASFPVKLISLLFRPFFIDAEGLLGYIASLENVVLLMIILSLVWRFRTSWAVAKRTLFARFSLFFFFMLTILLAMVNYNVGLGLRQKMMMMPALLVFFATVLAVLEARRQVAEAPRPHPGVPMTPAGYGSAT